MEKAKLDNDKTTNILLTENGMAPPKPPKP